MLDRRVGQVLVETGIISAAELKTATAYARSWNQNLGECLVDMGLATESEVARARAACSGTPVVKLESFRPTPGLLEQMDSALAHATQAMPVAWDPVERELTVAVADPSDVETLDRIARTTGAYIQPVTATASSIRSTLGRYYPEETPYGMMPRMPALAPLGESVFSFG